MDWERYLIGYRHAQVYGYPLAMHLQGNAMKSYVSGYIDGWLKRNGVID